MKYVFDCRDRIEMCLTSNNEGYKKDHISKTYKKDHIKYVHVYI